MGLFRSKSACEVCGSDKGKEIKDGYVCASCTLKGHLFLSCTHLSPKEQTVSLVKECIEKTDRYLKDQEYRKSIFTVSRKIGSNLRIDEANRLLTLKSILGQNRIYQYDQIHDFEVLEDGESIAKGGLGRAVAGGVLLGGVGAIVGGVTGGKKTKGICTNLQIRIALNEDVEENIYIKLITSETKKKSFAYKGAISIANDIVAFLSKVEKYNDENNTVEEIHEDKFSTDPYEEIKKAKELLDMGIITQDEFDIKKKQLLDL